METDQS